MSSIISRAHSYLLYAGGLYAIFLLALTLEPVQRSLIFLHQARYPFVPDFAHPEAYGFAPGKVLPLTLTTPDGEVLGAWLVLANDLYEEYVSSKGIPEGPLPQSVFDEALLYRDSMLYCHGNAASRAAPNRLRVARLISAQNINFLIFDYRGFADSTGIPSESGLNTDSRTAWDYLTLEKGVLPNRLSIMGQSLGTGVTVSLASSLALGGISSKAIILVAPFESIPELLETYKLGQMIPILAPFKSIPGAMNLFLSILRTKFDSKSLIQNIRSPILILHARNDATIPFSHGAALFDHLNTLSASKVTLKTTENVGSWGVVRKIERNEGEGKVIFGEAKGGGHNDIGSGEYSMSLIKEILS